MRSIGHLRSRLILCLIAILIAVIPTLKSQAVTLPTSFSQTMYGSSGFLSATRMEFAPDGRLFVLEQGGKVKIIKNGGVLSTPFLSLTVDSFFERGLLGIAFDPNFATNQFVYLYYTTDNPAPHNRISRFTANGDVALSGSEVVVMDLDNLSSAGNHNGGDLRFGPDGKLYVSVGNNANNTNSQSLSNRLGKVLRINSDGTIPTDNPFYTTASGANRSIWAYGLRNPYTVAFQPGTSRLHINDVGESSFEEINLGQAGANYGWPNTEGYTTDPRYVSPIYAYDHSSGQCAITGGAFYNPTVATFPSTYIGKYFFADYCASWIHMLNTSNNTSSSFASSTGSSIVSVKVGPDGALYYLARGSSSSSFNDGAVYRIQYAGASNPTATNTTVPTFIPPTTPAAGGTTTYQAESATLFNAVTETTNAGYTGASYVNYNNVVGSYVEFSISATQAGTYHLAFRYTNASVNDRPMEIKVNGSVVNPNLSFAPTGAWTTWTTQTLDVTLNAGTNIVRATATTVEGGPNLDKLEVTLLSAGTATPIPPTATSTTIPPTATATNIPPTATPTIVDQPPTPTISLPADGTHYNAGDTISFAGSATDPEDGSLPASAYSWTIVFHHDQHTHPFIGPIAGVTSDTFVIPTTGETSANTWYRIHLTVTDSAGMSTDVYRDIYPNVVNLTVQTNPAGLPVTVNGIPYSSPYTVRAVVGMEEPIGVDSPQSQNGTTYAFSVWSDGGAQTHNITIPSSDVTFTATFSTTGTSTPQAPTSYEAEAATLGGAAKIASCTACSGGQKVGYVGNNSGTLTFNVNASSTGAYTLTIYYLSGSARSASMSINGGAATTLNFASTGSFAIVGTMTVPINLNAGGNSIQFFNASAYAPDFDQITVAGNGPTPTNTATVIPPTVTATIPPTSIPPTATLTATATATKTQGNIAPSGTGYRWHGLTSLTSNSNKAASTGINDNNLTTDVSLTGSTTTDDPIGTFEAAGVIWSAPQSISTFKYINGSFDANSNGVFTGNFGLQYTTDGATWINAGWSYTPAYAYDSASAAKLTYTFTGAPLSVLGVRVVGQVHASDNSNSWHANTYEVQAQ